LKYDDNPATDHVDLLKTDGPQLKLGARIVLALSCIRPRERSPNQTIERRCLSDLRHFGSRHLTWVTLNVTPWSPAE